MKKTNAIIAAALAASILTSCGGTDTAEVTSAESTVSETTAATVSETDTMSAESEETTEITPAPNSAELEPTPPVVDDGIFDPANPQLHLDRQDDAEYIEITENTKFYECRYSTDNVVNDEKSFNNSVLIQKAKELLESSDMVSERTATTKELLEEAKDVVNIDTTADIEYKFQQGITVDFDGDGKEESFMVFDTYMGEDSISGVGVIGFPMLEYIVFADSSGNVQLMEDPSVEVELYELKYNGFSHLALEGGFNNHTAHSRHYSVNGNVARLELEERYLGGITDGFVLEKSYAQAVYSALIFWNAEAGKYVTPCAEKLSAADEETVFDMLPLDDKDDKEIAKMKENGIYVIGKKFFCIEFNRTYIYEDGKFTEYERNKHNAYYVANTSLPIAVNFDYDKAVENLIPIEEE
ncbi:MAG: hypothetical protein NC452_11265 [Eubacterium sp.]|nr:hypothetical protein [Eubacterium sp.]